MIAGNEVSVSRVFGKLLTVGSMAVVLAVGGCVDLPDPVQTEEHQAQDAWAAFSGRNYQGAYDIFSAVVAESPDNVDARHGLGWAALRLERFDEAMVELEAALDLGLTDAADGHAGRAIAARERWSTVEGFGVAIQAAQSALLLEPGYSFFHDPTLTWEDLRVLLAQTHFLLGHYALAQAEVDLLDSTNGLNPSSGTYTAELLAFIEQLGALYAGM